jgi:hypothetical protein
MAVIEQEGDPVLLRRDRILGRLVHHLQIGHPEFVAERRALVLAHRAGDDQRRFLRQMLGARELLGRDVLLEHHALQRAGAVADEQEVQLAARALVVEPSLEGHLLAVMTADVFHVDPGRLGAHCACYSTRARRWAQLT